MSNFCSKHPTISRWIDIVLYGLAGSFFAAYFCLPFSRLIQVSLERLFGSPLLIAVQFVCGLLILILLGVIHQSIRFRWTHFKHLRCYPPLVTSILIGLLLAEIWPRLNTGILMTNSEEAIPFYLLSGSYVVVLLLVGVLQRANGSNSPAIVDERVDDETAGARGSWSDYERWLVSDDPIALQREDWFGHREIAEACYNRLTEGGYSIALHGPYGAGKTTICRMIESLSIESKQRFIFTTVSCWGFESSASVQQHILDTILSEVSKEVDSLRLQGLPRKYIDAIDAHSKPVASVVRFFQSASDPVRLLSELEPVLKATKQRLILVIEDLDRNGTNFDRGDIVALLNRLRKIGNISVILAMAPDHQLDFLKVCDHFEPVPALSRTDVSKHLNEYRTLLLEHHSPAFILDELEPLEVDDFHLSQLERSASSRPLVTSLSNVIAAPRQLKVILRAVRSQWEALRGEVRVDDLIVINTLRHVEPKAYYFLIRNYAQFRSAVAASSQNSSYANEARDKLLAELKMEWSSVTDGLTSDQRSVQELIRFVDRSSGPIFGENSIGTVRKQSLTDDTRGYIYARRLFSGRVTADECLDQRILGLIQGAKSSREAALELAKAITFDREASNSYLAFYEQVRFTNHFVLISCVYEVMRGLPGLDTREIETPGFLATSKVYSNEVPEQVNVWLKEEVEKCIPSALGLMTYIFHHWCRNGSHRFFMAGPVHAPIQAAAIRQSICDNLKEDWSRMSYDEIGKCFEGAPCYTLFHLIFTVDFRETSEHLLNADSHWVWMKAYLWDATKAAPEFMLPQILVLVMKDSIPSSFSHSYELDEDRFGLFIDCSREEFFSFVVDHCKPDLVGDPSIQITLKVAVEYCQDQLRETNPVDLTV
jgi:Cdc6-like AAA superfamily ATPase